MARGGKRQGAGRKPGSTVRPVLRTFYTQAEIKAYVDDLKERAKTDARLKVFEGEHLFGKAVQPIGNDETGSLIISFDKTFSAQV